jgi:hypothetical protein
MITNIGLILLAVWLLLYALMTLVPMGHPMTIVMAVLAFVTAILILVGR